MPRRYKLPKSIRPSRPARHQKKKTTKMVKAMTKVAERVFHKNAENKLVVAHNGNNPGGDQRYSYALGFNSSISGSGDLYQLIPQISQGTTEGTRIGNTIRPRSLIIRGIVGANQAYSDSATLMARIFVASPVNYKSYNQLTSAAADLSQLLDFGQFGTGGFQGYPSDVDAKVNTKLWRVHKQKTFKIVKASGTGSGQSAPTGTAEHRFTMKIPCPKTLKFSQDSDLLPENFSPYLMIAYVDPSLTSGSPDYANQRIVASWSVDFEYEDA